MEATIIDISPKISESSPVWPGDTPFSRQWLCQIKDGSNIDLSTVTTTVHIGAHADAPSHYHRDGKSIDLLDLAPYIGPCVVVDATQRLLIEAHFVREIMAQSPTATRILFKTRAAAPAKSFETSFCAFAADAIDYLSTKGIVLIGIDTPSVDPFDSKDLPAHQALYRSSIRNLEGLDLSAATPGEYELIALPLPLVGFDASPVRAVLRR
jgi:arylformamidase